MPAVAEALDARIAALAEAGDRARLRSEATALLREALDEGRQALADSFAARPREALEPIRAQAALTDRIVRAAHRTALILNPLPNPTAGERLSLCAVGGYGRGEMAPFSDVDLLFLTPYKITPWAESVIETMLYMLWDLRLKVGHAARTVEECLRLGRADFTIRTALLENRLVAGDAALHAELDARLWDELFTGTEREFVEAKLAERNERHQRHGANRYVLEPNVKEAKGGLRDVQSMYWIAKYVYRVRDPAELVRQGMFTPTEFRWLRAAENFLWAVRCHLHLISGRAADVLSFDAQVEVARRMGYADHGGRRAVEHFMQDYFRHALRVGELTRIFVTALEARHVKREPGVMRLFNAARRRQARLSEGYVLVNGRINVADRQAFLADPRNMLRIFEEVLRTGREMHPDVMRILSTERHRFTDEVRNDPEAARIFLKLLLDYGNPERVLRQMNEVGVLSAYLPEFKPIVAMMQFNMYHHYTVDEHTIQCIWNLAEIERGHLKEDLPIASSILAQGVDRKVLYIALLLHDIGKGREEDHSVLGARIAAQVCPRLGFSRDETELVCWLVRHHLLMSDTAQKRDLSDPRTVRDFAREVGSVMRLKLLTVLTVCDIRGVGPGVWNNWKAQLLRDLYRMTHEALTTGLERFGQSAREDEARAAFAAALADRPELAERELARHYGPYWQGLDTDTQLVFARLLDGIGDDEIRIDITPDPARDVTRACFALADHPGLFARMAGALALVGANVVDARTYTSRDGYATAVFWIQDAEGRPYAKSRHRRLAQMIEKTLKGEVVAREALRDRDRLPRRMREFTVPTSITFDNEGSEIYTIIEVDTRDRPGLLHDLARTISAAGLSIHSAVIATYGAQAVDTFYVKDAFGLKLHSRSKRETLERRLREAIEAGSRAARA
ncbi:MAG: [protein-PII] uridylyltransferase [Alphaproteobacteria bacterium]|nr:MAG: [protein-PII] uridylyltransferase [Alphaproteobacteria bacterium]